MKASVTNHITIVLDECEAKWLKDLVQNYLGENLDDESDKDRKIRSSFWDALDEFI